MSPPLLAARGLTVDYERAGRPAVDDIDLTIAAGEAVGLLGESGCGKTSLALALVGMLPENAAIGGRVELGGERIDDLDEAGWRAIRGERIGVVFQQPSQALSPFRRVGQQIADVLRAHGRSRDATRRRVVELLDEVELAPDVGRAYPHQLSGGQRQRVVLCQALACEPELLLADEPTASLDREIEARILDLVDRLRRDHGLALLWISHDPGVHERLAERLLVMYGGQVVEEGPAGSVLQRPAHPYTEALLACRPGQHAKDADADSDAGAGRWRTIPEGPLAPEGCPFRPRCPRAVDVCREPQPWNEVGEGRVRCVLPVRE